LAVTEQEWLHCLDPLQMLEFVRGKASDRKLRLFACGCCRRVRKWMKDPRSRHGVEVAERYADGLSSEEDLARARQETGEVWTTVWGDAWHIYQAARAAHFACGDDADTLLRVPSETRNAARNAVPYGADPDAAVEAEVSEVAGQIRLVWDLFDNVVCPVTVERCGWTPAVLQLAQTIYVQGAFGRMPELAALLEEGGCANADLLDHCRHAGRHARGCWVLDLVLGRK
jgi:hypothetical protein